MKRILVISSLFLSVAVLANPAGKLISKKTTHGEKVSIIIPKTDIQSDKCDPGDSVFYLSEHKQDFQPVCAHLIVIQDKAKYTVPLSDGSEVTVLGRELPN